MNASQTRTDATASQYVLDQYAANPRGWADPPDPRAVTRPFTSFSGPVRVDPVTGRPLNPRGEVGKPGRGDLGRWGANFAADPIVLRFHPERRVLELLAIERPKTGKWALPGGMVDPGEDPRATAARELHEETQVTLDLAAGALVFQGFVSDPRNTDHAWMESSAVAIVLPWATAKNIQPQRTPEAVRAEWVPVNAELLAKMYASHADMLQRALDRYFGSRDPAAARERAAGMRDL